MDADTVLALCVSALDESRGSYKVGCVLSKPCVANAPAGDDDESPVRSSLHVYSFDDSQFLLSLDALLVREKPGLVVIDKAHAKVEGLLAQHGVEFALQDLAKAGWPRSARDVAERTTKCLRFACGDAGVARHEACLAPPLAARAAALLLEHRGLREERAADAGACELWPGALGSHMRLDSAAAEAVNLVPGSDGGNDGLGAGSLLEVLGGPCKTKAGYALVEAWLRQPSLDLGEITQRHDVVEVLRDEGEARDGLRVALGGAAKGRTGRVPDLGAFAAKLRSGKATLLDLHKLHVLASRVLPEVVDALAAVPCDAANALAAELLPSLKKAQRDLRGYCDMADATLDLEFLPEVLLKASVDEELVEHATAMREARGAIDDAHEAVNRAVDDCDAVGARGYKAGGERAKWPVKLDKDAARGRVFRCVRRYDEKSLKQVRTGKDGLEILSYLKNGVYFTTEALVKACGAYQAAKGDYEQSQRALTAELVKTAATYAPVFARCGGALARLDALTAFATAAAFAPGGAYCRPALAAGDGAPLELKGARHPVVEHRDGVTFIANDYALGGDAGSLVLVTGPNMGGKSTYIRGLAALAVMAQAGSLVPCEAAALPLFDSVLARVGAGDSLTKGVSTFMAEMLEASQILHVATPRSLVIIDELGRGTSTYDGFGLAWAISEHILLESKAKCLFATHFHELTQLADDHPGRARNRHVSAHVDDDTGKITFLYEVRDGPCLESFGIKVAELAGFPDATLAVAKRKAADLEAPGGKQAKVAVSP